MSASTSESTEKIILPLRMILILNVLIVAVFAWFLIKDRLSVPCVLPDASMWGLAIVLLMLFDLLGWPILRLLLLGLVDSIPVGPLKIPTKLFVMVCDQIFLWELPTYVRWPVCLMLIVVVAVFGLSPLSLFPLQEPTPFIQRFEVSFTGQDPKPYKSNDVIEISAGQQILVKALPDSSDVVCYWSANNGTLLPAKGCSIQYSWPFGKGGDALAVRIQSPCTSKTAVAGLHIVSR